MHQLQNQLKKKNEKEKKGLMWEERLSETESSSNYLTCFLF